MGKARELIRMTYDECARQARLAQNRVRKLIAKDAPAPRQRSYHGPYSGARMSRLEFDWIASCQAADEEVKRDAYRLRARARDLSRNNPLAKQYLRLVKQNVIGANGFKHQAQIRDNSGKLNKALNDKTEAAFEEWAERCSLDGRHGLIGLQRQLLTGARCDGEALVRKWTGPGVENAFGLALEPIDPDQLDHTLISPRGTDTNEIRMGIEVDLHGRPVAYHVWDRPFSWAVQRKLLRIAASEILHLYDPERVNQTRGITDFHPVTLALHFLGEYAEAELVAARIGASKVIIWKRRDGAVIGEKDPNDPLGNNPQPIDELEPGMFGFAPDGYEPSNVQIDHPSDAFEAFMRDQKRDTATALGVSYAALTADLSNTSYSSARTGTLLERDTWRTLQNWWLGAFVRPVYRAWLNEALLVGAETAGRQGLVLDTRDPRRLAAASWTPRGFDWVDPLKDADASIRLVSNGMLSRTRVAAERGMDLEDLFDELAREEEMARERGITIASEAAAPSGSSDPEDDEKPEGTAGEEGAARGHANGNGIANRIGRLLEAPGREPR